MQSHVESAVGDRRLLLRHALQEYKDKGGQIAFPVGCSGFDGWLMDALDVPLVLNQINKRGKLDLIVMCSAAGSLNNSILSRLPSNNSQEHPSSAAGGAGGGIEGTSQRKSLPHLQIPSMAINIDEREMQMLAFQIFVSACGSKASPALLQTVRAQLEIGEALGKDLTTVTQLANKNGISSLSTIDALVTLLQIVPSSAFQSFRSFAAWRSGIASVISKSLEHAAAHSWVSQQGGDAAKSGAPARSLLASLRGSLRRMDVCEADDYEETEYFAAARGVEEATRRLAGNITGGDLTFPMGLSIQVAEMLLCGVFDSLDEGQFVPEAQELLSLLSSNVWPQLGISPQMNSALGMWVHFRQYMASKETSLLHAGVLLAQSATGTAANSSAADAAFTSKVLDALSAEASTALSDYHTSFANTGEMQVLLEFLRSIYGLQNDKNNNDAGAFEGMLTRCIKASVGAAFARRAAEVHNQVALEEDRTALLATETSALLHVERNQFVPILRQYQPAAAAIAADTLHELYGAKMLTWLISVNCLTKSVAATIHASVDLESELMAEIAALGGAGASQQLPPPWGAVQRITPLLHNWAQQQVSNMYGWLDRIMAEEDWSPVVQQRGATSRSAVEVLKVMDDAVDTLFGMGIAVPASVVNALVDGMDAVLQKYCKMSLASVGTADSLVPPAPPLTRFKKDLAESAEVEAMGGSSGIKSVTNKVGAALVTSWLPSLTQDQQSRILGVMYDTLVVRANSMYYLATKTSDLEALVKEKWHAAQEEEVSADAASFRGTGFLNGAVASAAEGVDNILRFITLKLVCGDLRSAIFKDLYAFHVEYSRIQSILEEVDGALGMLCEMLDEGLAPRMAGHVCKTLSAAVLHVLLDGGPNRLFTLQDMPILLEDFEQLRAMFFAEGAGLDPTAVGKLCLPLENALYTMSLDTKALITASKTTKKQPLKASAGSAEGILDPETVLRVLCHRADYEASKFLKKDHKIPKKLPNVFSASVSRSFAALSFPTSATKATKQGGVRRMEANP